MKLLTTTARDINIEQEDWPRCEVCDMPVEQFCVTDGGNAIALAATCHGEVEMVVLLDDTWDTVHSSQVDFGPAFAKEQAYEQ